MTDDLEHLLTAGKIKYADFVSHYKIPPAGFYPELDVLTEIAFLTLGWTVLFILIRYFVLPKRSYDFNNRLVSVIHCFIVFPMALQTLDLRDPLKNVGGHSTKEEGRVLEISCAYFVYDFIICLLDKSTRDVSMAAHHIVSTLGVLWGLLHQTDGNELLACLALVEISNPCMHTREFIKELGLRGSRLEMANKVLFALTFLAARSLFGPYLTYKTLTSPLPPLAIKIGAAGLQIVSSYWSYLVARMVVYEVRKLSSRKVKDR